jgi:gamma-butyrobetaine hydroxylase
MATIVAVESHPRHVSVQWSDGHTSTFHHVWLRDNCPQKRHPQTNHRVDETSSIPLDIAPTTVGVVDGALQVSWHDDHVSTFDPMWLARYDYSNGARRSKPQPTLWDGSFAPRVPRMTYDQLFSDTKARIEWIRGFRDYGVAIMTGLPNVEGTVAKIGDELGRVRETSWGRTFDVKSIAKANSLAYTSLPLVLHTDEGYRDPAPTVQLQHFLVSESTGGDATLVDGFKVAHDLRQQAPEKFDLLCNTELYFHFADVDIVLENDGPIIELDPAGEVKAVRFSNHSCQPFLIDSNKMEAFYDAYATFGTMREDPRYRIQVPMGAGEMYMVNNRRVMHGRTGFTSGGSRHLQSCYIETDELYGRLAILEHAALASR